MRLLPLVELITAPRPITSHVVVAVLNVVGVRAVVDSVSAQAHCEVHGTWDDALSIWPKDSQYKQDIIVDSACQNWTNRLSLT